MKNYTAYLATVKPRKSKLARLYQYHSLKNKLLPQYPTKQHDKIIRAICRRLKI